MGQRQHSEGPESPALTPAMFHILLALAGGERHGYAIMQVVADDTDEAVRLGPGTLYRSIKQLLAIGLIEESGERPDPQLDDERRRYYRLTALGDQAMRAEFVRLGRLVSLGRRRGLLGVAAQSSTGGA
jgi:DNA-binding PadR family transcriptional regulator